jgi:hypothetical protein
MGLLCILDRDTDGDRLRISTGHLVSRSQDFINLPPKGTRCLAAHWKAWVTFLHFLKQHNQNDYIGPRIAEIGKAIGIMGEKSFAFCFSFGRSIHRPQALNQLSFKARVIFLSV